MEEEINSKPISLKWAVIFGLISTLYMLGTAIARVSLPFIGWIIGIAIMCTCFALAIKEYKAANGGYITFGKGFSMGMFISLIGGLIRSLVYYIYLKLDPGYLEFMQEAQRNSPFGPQQDQDVPQQMEGLMNFLTGPEFIGIVTFVSAIFGGLILGAIVSAITKNEEEEY